MNTTISRRTFLQAGGAAIGALLAGALADMEARAEAWSPVLRPASPLEVDRQKVGRARVATQFLYVYQEPNFKSDLAGSIRRDEIVAIEEEVNSPHGPTYNPRWYRIDGGYLHSGRLQRVDGVRLNPVLRWLPESGQLGEITVPWVQCLRKTLAYGWVPLYRLYYQSVYWITSLEEGPDGNVWYGLTDDLLHVQYCVPASFVRPILPEELDPISPGIPGDRKRIEVDTWAQTLTAYEGDEIVLHTRISSGLPSNGPSPNGIPTDTPQGSYHVEVKVPSRHMGDGELTDDIEAYELPGVPWVLFFHVTGVGFHGTYWHDNFGRKMSHGCVNMRTEDAKWLYRWADPLAGPQDWNKKGHGTLVKVF